MEKHYHHDGKQQLRFYKSVHIKTCRQSKKKDFLVMLFLTFCVEQKCIGRNEESSFVHFTKSRTKDNIKCHILQRKLT